MTNNTVREKHDTAMNLLDECVYRDELTEDEISSKMGRALALEIEAAEGVPPDENGEPTRSILFSSAASIAFQMNKYDICRELIARTRNDCKPSNYILSVVNDLEERMNQ